MPLLLAIAACDSPEPPTPCGSLADQTVTVGETATVTACFEDPNGDVLTYTATSSDPSVATASMSGTTVTARGVAPGLATVTVTASDPDGMQAQARFGVTVPNRAPEARGTIEPVTVAAGDTATVDLAAYFTEPDGETLAYSAASSDAAVASVTAQGSSVTIAGVARGAADITVTATDPGGLSATQGFTATVPNRGPDARGEIPALTIEAGDTVTLDMTPYFSDPDGDTLAYTATTPETGVLTVTADQQSIIIVSQARGTADITVTATDPGGLTATQSFQATVANQAPEARGQVPAATIEADDTLALDASPYFSDPDGDTLTYSATTSDPAVATVSAAGSTVTIVALARGTADITVTATDPGGLTAAQSFQATVANQAPEARGQVPAATIEADDTLALDASPYFSDPDGDTLTYSATTSDPAVATVSAAGSTVTIVALARGTADITVTATDPGGLTAAQSFQATVANQAPEARGQVPAATIEADDTLALDASPYFSDPDGDTLTYSATTSDPAVATVSAAGSTVTIVALARGTADMTVTATDPGGLTAAQSFQATVPNQAPEARGQVPAATIEADDTLALDASPYFSDPDGDTLTYSATTSDPAVATVSAAGSTVTIVALARGTADMTVTATDPGGLTAAQSFQATVANQAPEARGQVPAATIEADDTLALDASPYFSDPDGDTLTYSATTSDPAVATVSAAGSTVTIVALARGTADITVTATDPGGLTAAQSFQATVANQAPEARGQVPAATIEADDTLALDASPYFSDPDGDTLTYSATTSDPAVATVSAAGSTVTIVALARGTADMTVTATDPGGLTAAQSFQATVPNQAPEARGQVPAATIEADDTLALDASPYFSDPDGDTLTYSATTSDPAVATVSAAGSTVTIVALARGTADITVTATDPGGLTAAQSFQATVANQAPEARGQVPAATIEADDTLALDASPYFSDPDGDTLTYSATTSDPAVATVSAAGSTVTIVALARGTADMTVTATDPGGLTAAQSFQATVPNRPPEAREELPDFDIDVGVAAGLDLAPYFGDPDGDTLAYTAISSDPAVATASADDTTITVTGVAPGAATLSVTARDREGLEVTQSSEIVVLPPPNEAPEPVGTIPAQNLVPGDTVSIDATSYFHDPDGDPLVFTAESSAPQVATASVSGDTVTITAGRRTGTAVVTVTASDPGGLTATQQVTVAVESDTDVFRDDFATSASLSDWHLIDADAEVAGGVLHLTGTREFEQGWASRGHPLTEWTAKARIGRAEAGTSAGLTMVMNHDRFLLFIVEIGSGIEVDGEDTNYRLLFYDAEKPGFILAPGFHGKSDAIRDGPGEFTEITFALKGRQLSLHAGTTRLFISEKLSSALPVEITGYVLTEWSHDDIPGKTALFDWFEIEGDAVSGNARWGRSEAADLIRRLSPAGRPDRIHLFRPLGGDGLDLGDAVSGDVQARRSDAAEHIDASCHPWIRIKPG